MKKIKDYVLKSQLKISWDRWNFTGIFGIILTTAAIKYLINLVGYLVKYFINL
jgi:hypothetical protein